MMTNDDYGLLVTSYLGRAFYHEPAANGPSLSSSEMAGPSIQFFKEPQILLLWM
jgi:hypothetical protein